MPFTAVGGAVELGRWCCSCLEGSVLLVRLDSGGADVSWDVCWRVDRVVGLLMDN